jgi:hypothetical protein
MQGEKAKQRADHARGKAEQHFIAAGQHLITLKANYAPSWEAWETLLKAKVRLSNGRASELMQLADGRKDLQQIRAGKADSVAQLRAHLSAQRSSSLQADVVKKINSLVEKTNEEHGEIERDRNVTDAERDWAATALRLSGEGMGEGHFLIEVLSKSTPATRNAAAKLIVEGSRQGEFELVRDAVADLYEKLARAGR